MRVAFFDAESHNNGKRVEKNATLIRAAASDGLFLNVEVQRTLKDLDPDRNFPYDAVIVQGLSPDADVAYLAALLGFEKMCLPSSRIIYLGCKQMTPPAEGQYVLAQGGNGHLLPQDAKYVADILSQFSKRTESLST